MRLQNKENVTANVDMNPLSPFIYADAGSNNDDKSELWINNSVMIQVHPYLCNARGMNVGVGYPTLIPGYLFTQRSLD